VFGNHRYRLCVLLACIVFSVQPGKSDTLVINDLTDVITVNDVGGNDTIDIKCNPLNLAQSDPAEQCTVDITRPGFTIFDASTFFMQLLEPVDLRISDDVSGAQQSNTGYRVFVSSYDSIGAAGNPGTVETGLPQDTFAFILWCGIPNGCATDDIQFESDVIESTTTPEPSTLALLGSGLLGFASLYRRRFKNS